MRAANAQMSLHIRTVSSQPFLLELRKKRRCRWRFRPNFVPAKVVALLLLIHSLIILPWDCGGSLLGPCLVLYYSGVLSSFAIILTRNREHGVLLYCLPTINVLWLFLTVPWIGLKCVNEVLPDHTHSLFYGPLYQSLVLIAYSSRKGSNETAHLHSLTRALKIALKRWDVDEGSAKFYRPVQESLVLMAGASNEGSG